MEQKNIRVMVSIEKEAPPRNILGDEMAGEVKKEDLIELGDILEATAKTLRRKIQSESTLTIEFTGQVVVEHAAAADVGFDQIIVFKVSGSQRSDRATTMRVTLETKIKPEK